MNIRWKQNTLKGAKELSKELISGQAAKQERQKYLNWSSHLVLSFFFLPPSTLPNLFFSILVECHRTLSHLFLAPGVFWMIIATIKTSGTGFTVSRLSSFR